MDSTRLRRLARGLAALAAGALLLAGGAFAAPKAGGKGYDYYLTGNAADAVSTAPPTTASTVLMGGGPDVDDAFRWMIRKAGGGDFVVLRVRGTDGYNAYVYAMGGLDSVETLVVKTRDAAADPFVLDRIAKAEAIFIAGGDQSDYIRLWKGTPLAAALDDAKARKVPIGGTSAGLAVLGQFDFSALNGSVTSADALADPYDKRVTLDRDFLTAPSMLATIADAHLDTRDRMGRLVVFLARIVQDRWAGVADARAIGVDVDTALVVDDGVGVMLRNPGTSGAVYFLRPSIAPTVCAPRTPLTFRNVDVQRLDDGGRFDVAGWRSRDAAVTRYDLSAEAGVLLSSQAGGAIY